MDIHMISLKEMRALVDSNIVTLVGINGQPITTERAAYAPSGCEAHASSGNTYELSFDAGVFELTPKESGNG